MDRRRHLRWVFSSRRWRTLILGTLYTLASEQGKAVDSYCHLLGLNHLSIVVDDLDAAEQAVIAAGFQPHSHANYEPGRRFYFEDKDGLEFEVISYR
jgi:catechol 2,3-dioxygenase-like lactoylglutathione lyase family enzyme